MAVFSILESAGDSVNEGTGHRAGYIKVQSG